MAGMKKQNCFIPNTPKERGRQMFQWNAYIKIERNRLSMWKIKVGMLRGE